jgi:hypothetical protein
MVFISPSGKILCGTPGPEYVHVEQGELSNGLHEGLPQALPICIPNFFSCRVFAYVRLGCMVGIAQCPCGLYTSYQRVYI